MRRWVLKQKFMIDMGFQVLPIVNFTLLVAAVSDKLLKVTGIPRVWMLLVVAVPAAFIGIWLMGFILDRFRYTQGLLDEHSLRNPTWNKSVMYFEDIVKRLKRLEGK